MKPAIIVADTSPLIALAIMDLLPILNSLYKNVFVPPAVVKECLEDLSKPKAEEIRKILEDNVLLSRSPENTSYCELLEQVLDRGEAEAIALAKELNAMAMIDERAARGVAARESIECIGSLHVLITAKKQKLIPEATPLLEKLIEHGYHLDKSLIRYVVQVCGESKSDH